MKDIFLKIFILIAGVSVSFISSTSRANLTQADLTQYANANVCQGPQNQTVTNACSITKKECVADFSSCMATASTNGTCSMASDGTIQCTGILLCQSTNDDGDCVDWGYQDYNQVFHFCAVTAKNDFSSKLDDSCKTVCGDGIVGGDEVCDGSKTKSGYLNLFTQKCSKDCKVISTCGNGIKEGDETCDEGDPNNGGHNGEDKGHCNLFCSGFSAAPFPSQGPHCGDGLINVSGEECDDGNTLDGDGCDSHCKKECGNGVLEGNEMCDGNSNQFNGQGYCDDSCIYHPSKLTDLTCYNDKVKDICYQEKKQCLNAQDSKICANQFFACLQKSENECKEIPIFFFSACGDGKVEDGESCDEGAKNGTSGSHCDAKCGYVISDQTNSECFYDNSYNNGNSGMSKCMAQQIACKKQGGPDCPVAFHQCLVDEEKVCSLSDSLSQTAKGDGSGPHSSSHMGCSFLPGAEASGSVGPWLVFALGLLPVAGRRWKKSN